MGKNYYQTLQISREATQEQIIQSYRRLALKHHPIKNAGELAANSYKFAQISQAFDVLSDQNRRAIYDQYGEELLKQGITDSNGSKHDKFIQNQLLLDLKGGYAFMGNSFQIFEDVFGNLNPFIDLIQGQDDVQGSLFQDSFKAQGEKKPDMPKDLEVVIQCTLQEFFLGCVKDFKVKREKLALDGKHTKIIKQTQKIEVKPGYGKKTLVRNAEQGHQSFGNKTTDLVIRFKEKKDDKFSRKDNDLIYTHTISLIDAINATSFQLVSLDGRVLHVGVDSIITPQTFKLIKGEGMPIFDQNPLAALTKSNKKGDLYIKFNIIFPKYIPEQKKQQLRQILAEEEQVEMV